jgi:hypothetical protein
MLILFHLSSFYFYLIEKMNVIKKKEDLFSFRNNRYMSIVHLCRSDGFDLHHERLFHIDE